jgi:hypothetical protein
VVRFGLEKQGIEGGSFMFRSKWNRNSVCSSLEFQSEYGRALVCECFFFSTCLMRPISMIGFIYILGMVLIFMLHYIFVNNDDFFIFLCKSSCS